MSEQAATAPGQSRIERAIRERWGAAWGFALLGFAGVVVGGFAAAFTGPWAWSHGSWAAAYLVLVVGVAQWCLGLGQAWLAREPPSGGVLGAQLATWNLGSVLVIMGAVLPVQAAVNAGGVLLAVALMLFVRTTWHEVDGPAARWVRRVYLLLVLVVLASIPVGLMLANR